VRIVSKDIGMELFLYELPLHATGYQSEII